MSVNKTDLKEAIKELISAGSIKIVFDTCSEPDKTIDTETDVQYMLEWANFRLEVVDER